MTTKNTVNNKLYLLDTTFLEDEEKFSFWYEKMGKDRKKKIDSFKVFHAKRESLGVGILQIKAFEEIGIDNHELGFGEQGKPFLKNVDGVCFNQSHTEKMAVLAISDKEIGVDIEKNMHFGNSLVEYIFNEYEISLAKEEAEKNSYTNVLKDSVFSNKSGEEVTPIDIVYTRFWTMKESVMKHSGMGIMLDPKKIEIFLDGDNLNVRTKCYDCEKLYLTCRDVLDYQITVCSFYKDFPDIIMINYE